MQGTNRGAVQAAGAILIGVWTVPALAEVRDSRLSPLSNPALHSDQAFERMRDSAHAVTSARSIDRLSLASVRLLDAGPIQVSFFGARIRNRQNERGAAPPISDRYTARTASAGLGIALGTDFSLTAEGVFTHMRRYLVMVPVASRPLATNISSIGLGLKRAGRGQLKVEYVNIATAKRRNGADRMGEILGNAPLAGEGVRISLSNMRPDVPSDGLSWTVVLSSMHPTARDTQFVTSASRTADNRAELAFRIGI